MNKNILNIISILRICSCGLIFLIGNNNILFLAFFLIIGCSDVIDGYIARKYKLQSKLGAQLDSIGDVVFFISVFVYLCLNKRDLLVQYKEALSFSVSCKIIPVIVSLIKNRKPLFIHTLMNKISGVIVFVGIILILVFEIDQIIYVIAITIALAGIEEAIIIIIRKNPDLNTLSVFNSGKK